MRKIFTILFLFVTIALSAQVKRFPFPNSAHLGGAAGGDTYADIIGDGNTLAVYIADATYLTEDGSSNVIQWADSTGNNYDLDTIPNETFQDDLHFAGDSVYTNDGLSHARLVDTFTLDQPFTIYAVLSPQEWVDGDVFFGGGGSSSLSCTMDQDEAADSVYITTDGSNYVGPDTINVYEKVIIRTVWNGSSSKIQINERTAVTGNVGTNNFEGFTLFDRRDGNRPSHLAVWKIIIRSGDDDDADELTIVRRLNREFTVY